MDASATFAAVVKDHAERKSEREKILDQGAGERREEGERRAAAILRTTTTLAKEFGRRQVPPDVFVVKRMRGPDVGLFRKKPTVEDRSVLDGWSFSKNVRTSVDNDSRSSKSFSSLDAFFFSADGQVHKIRDTRGQSLHGDTIRILLETESWSTEPTWRAGPLTNYDYYTDFERIRAGLIELVSAHSIDTSIFGES